MNCSPFSAAPRLRASAFVAVVLSWSAVHAGADVRRRWYVDFELGVPKAPLESLDWANRTSADFHYGKPELFLYRDRLGAADLCWFVAFTLHNPSDQYVPIQVDLMLHTDQGKDYHQDIVRTQPDFPHRGKYYSSAVAPPDVELQIVSKIEALGNRNEEMRRERLGELKRENRYLNPAELRRRQILKPAETVTGLAVFRGVDKNTDMIEIMVGGLVDVIKIDKVESGRVHYAYENRVLHVLYEMPGDEYADLSDFVGPRFPKQKWWETQQVGPAGDKETVKTLIDMLEMEDAVMSKEMKAKLPSGKHAPVLRHGANAALVKLTGQDFGYEGLKSPKDPANVDAIRLWKEWWTRHNEKLVYNDRLNAFEIKKQDIPGAVDVKPPYKQ